MVDGRLFVSTAWSKAFAFDAATGKLLWSFDPKVPGATGYKACCDVVNRGVAVAGGKVFLATLDGRLIALDAATGKQIWSTVTVDQSQSYTSTGAPRVAKGKVFIGNSGAEYGVRGYVSAYDQETGKLVWRFYTVPGDPAKGPDHAASDDKLAEMGKTWFGKEWIKTGGGGTVWDSIVYDEELNRLYVGVGNGTPHNYYIRSEGKGDNLFLSSILALDPDTGKYLWHYQETPAESWDYTATQQIMLTTVTIDGQTKKVLFHAPKNGLFYVIDRDAGKPISATPFTENNWFLGMGPDWRPMINPKAYYKDTTALVRPGSTGGHSWHPMSYSPLTGLVYLPTNHDAQPYTPLKPWAYNPGGWNLGLDFAATHMPRDPAVVKKIAAGVTGALVAWDPVAKKARWTVEQPNQRYGGTLATAGNLVFQGTADGHFLAYTADAGQKVWDYTAGNGIVAGPISYALDGVQYVAVLAGFGGSTITSGFAFPQKQRLPGRLLVFKLDGKAEAPAYQVAEMPPLKVTEPRAKSAVLQLGEASYSRQCMVCHGAGAYAGILPNLTRSPAILDKDSFDAIVADGALTDHGMVSFKDRLSPTEIEAVRQYLQDLARDQH
jgi:quinohemoprotein ethanol dehydrogenase